jgi:hypothetical protein
MEVGDGRRGYDERGDDPFSHIRHPPAARARRDPGRKAESLWPYPARALATVSLRRPPWQRPRREPGLTLERSMAGMSTPCDYPRPGAPERAAGLASRLPKRRGPVKRTPAGPAAKAGRRGDGSSPPH